MSDTPNLPGPPAQRPPDTFRKAVLQKGDAQPFPGSGGYLVHAPTCTEVVGTPDYERLLAAGYRVVESWQVWRCQTCGAFDSDREHDGMVGMSHPERYGHESVRPDELQRSGR